MDNDDFDFEHPINPYDVEWPDDVEEDPQSERDFQINLNADTFQSNPETWMRWEKDLAWANVKAHAANLWRIIIRILARL